MRTLESWKLSMLRCHTMLYMLEWLAGDTFCTRIQAGAHIKDADFGIKATNTC